MATQTITVTNLLSTTIPDPINIALDDLTPGGYADQLQRIIRRVALHHRRSLKFELAPGASASVTLKFQGSGSNAENARTRHSPTPGARLCERVAPLPVEFQTPTTNQ